MVAIAHTFAFIGVEPKEVQVQVHMGSGLPAFNIVGLAAKAVNESKERVRAALSSMGINLPPKRITVNLSPADLPKEGSHYDLPIALGVLMVMEIIPESALKNNIIMGELALDASITQVSGVLPAAMGAAQRGFSITCPKINGPEASWADDEIVIISASNLTELIEHFNGEVILPKPNKNDINNDNIQYPDLKDVKGQKKPKRALEIAAAGGHNMLMIGPPGSGKSMLASRLPSILPPMSPKEMLEVSVINSIAGVVNDNEGLSFARPFRDPHHSASIPALVGGGAKAKPGEISLSHNGVLFLDELPEFNRVVLDSLRQPLETREVAIARAQNHVTYPANFQLIAAMNPCRCGYMGDAERECNKVPICGKDYQSKISGPMLDRIDIHIQVPAVNPYQEFEDESESSADIRQRVLNARKIQANRHENILTNSEAEGELLKEFSTPSKDGEDMLKQAVVKFNLSMRSHNRVLKVARTIADLASSATVEKEHIAEALSYRQLQYGK